LSRIFCNIRKDLKRKSYEADDGKCGHKATANIDTKDIASTDKAALGSVMFHDDVIIAGYTGSNDRMFQKLEKVWKKVVVLLLGV
jgi:hypothetical protein